MSSSGDGLSLGQNPGNNNIKSTLAANNHSTSEWKLVKDKNKPKFSTSNMPNTFISLNLPNLLHIILTIIQIKKITYWLYLLDNDYFSLQCGPINKAMVANIKAPPFNNFTDNYNLDKNTSKPEIVISNNFSSRPQQALPADTCTKNNIDQYLKKIASKFKGLPIIIIELIDLGFSIDL